MATTFTPIELETGILINHVLDAAIADIVASGKPVTPYSVQQWIAPWAGATTGMRCQDESYVMGYLSQEGFVNELEVELYCSKLIASGIVSAMSSQFSQETQYRCRHCGYVDADRHMFNGAMNCIYCQQDRLAPTIVPDSEWDSYNPGKLASEPDIYGYDD